MEEEDALERKDNLIALLKEQKRQKDEQIANLRLDLERERKRRNDLEGIGVGDVAKDFTILELQEVLSKSEEENQGLRCERERAAEEIIRLNRRIGTLLKANKHLEDKNEAYRGAVEAKDEIIKGLRKKEERLEQGNLALDKECQKRIRDLQVAKGQIAKLEGEIETLKQESGRECEVFGDQLGIRDKRIVDLLTENEELKAQLLRDQKRLMEKNSILESFKAALLQLDEVRTCLMADKG